MKFFKAENWKVVLPLLLIAGCTRFCGMNRTDMTPEQVVEMYLDIALNMTKPEQRNNLMQFTTGSLKAAIAGVSDETIRQAYIDRKYDIVSYSVVERRDRTPRETEITFQLTYKDLGRGSDTKKEDAAQITTENTVSVVREEGAWYLRDVIGQKTAIDFPVSPESQIQAKPGVITTDDPTENDALEDNPPVDVETQPTEGLPK